MKVNGKLTEQNQSISILNLLESLGYNENFVAVEVNFKICKKADYSNTFVGKDDNIEIVKLVQGG